MQDACVIKKPKEPANSLTDLGQPKEPRQSIDPNLTMDWRVLQETQRTCQSIDRFGSMDCGSLGLLMTHASCI